MRSGPRISLADLSQKFQAEAAAQIYRPAPAQAHTTECRECVAGVKAAARLLPTTDEARLNGTERAYLAELRRMGLAFVGVQCVTFKLADDCRYSPDFLTVNRDGLLTAIEVKGFWRDDARVKVKVAARLFPFIAFVAVRKSAGGAWNYEEIKP